jgi:formamidopyrimidine-DNA glycosylase
MPELPEVETIKRGLLSTVIDQKIQSIDVLLPKIFIGNTELILGSYISSVDRKGKLLIIALEDSSNVRLFLTIHLKMTGQLLFKSETRPEFALGHPIPPLKSPIPNKSTRAIFVFESGDRLYFNDIRTFGYIKVLDEERLKLEPFLLTVGVEPLTPEFTVELFKKLVSRSVKVPVKPFLLDQTKVAGLGNIYTDEALFWAKIHPTRLIGSLSEEEVERLYISIRKVLTDGVDTLGSSKSSYVTLAGKVGSFLEKAAVYQRAGLPCVVCGNPILRISFRGRGTHFCGNCQK